MAEKKVIDARGTFCPGPLMELIAGMKLINVGDELEVLSTDKGSASDIPEWVNKVRITGPQKADESRNQQKRRQS